jgi:hypothetical protein
MFFARATSDSDKSHVSNYPCPGRELGIVLVAASKRHQKSFTYKAMKQAKPGGSGYPIQVA